MKKIVFLVVSVLVYTLYLIYSYNGHLGRSYIFEPVHISIRGDLPESTRLKIFFQTINDPTTNQEAHLLSSDSIPEDTYIFKIDSSYRLANFSIYFQSLPANEEITITQIKASSSTSRVSYFSLKGKDLSATDNLNLVQASDTTIRISKILSGSPAGAALSFNMRSSYDELFVRTNSRIPEIPSLLSFLIIAILGLLMVYLLHPLRTQLRLKDISMGAYVLALTILILPSGEKVCNLLLAVAILAGIITAIRKGSIRSRFMENRRLLIIVISVLLVYILALLFSRNDPSHGNLMTIKFGLPLTLVAIALNTNNTHEIRIQYAAILTGVIISVFIHFGWIVMLADSVGTKGRLLSHPHHYLETSVFSRVHHSYLSVIYLVSLVLLFFKKKALALQMKDVIIYSILIVTALLFAFSRAAVLSLALILIFHASRKLFHLLNKEISHVVRIVTASVFSLAFIAFIFFDFNIASSNGSFSVKGIQMRIQIWENASDLIKQKPLAGWGPGNYNAALQETNNQFIINTNTWGSLNTHNQLLETSGMFGLLVGMALIYLLFFPTGFSRQSTRFSVYIFSISIIFITAFLFESFLSRNLGILIFGIVFGLLLKTKPDSS